MPSRDSHDSGWELPFFLCVMLALLILLFTSGCAPQHTRPKGVPYPQQLGPQLKAYPMEKVRCLGGGLGGCGGWML